jgi:hypothetical protein
MDFTSHLDLPFLMPAQAQKHVTLNESLLALDTLVHLAVEDRDLTAPPGSPVEGARYIVAATATGAWTGREDDVAAFEDGAWAFRTPVEGWRAWVSDEDRLVVFDGADWIDANPEEVSLLGVNTSADETKRLAVSSATSLFTHAGASHRLTVNKAASGDTASVLLQNAFSGRAELGLCGDDKLHLKVSGDGAAWSEALVIDNANARVGLGVTAPAERLHIAGNMRVQDTAAFFGFYNSAGTTRTGYLQAHASAGFYFAMELAQPMYFLTSNAVRMTILASGEVGIGGVTSPTTALHVNGGVRVGQSAKASLPGAATVGAGALLYVTDEAGGAVMAFSDGTNWRRVTDRAVVS